MRLLARAAAVALLAAAAGLAIPAAPASAAACSTGDGVTVVVDFQGLGGGVQSVCDPDGAGSTAATLFGSNGFALTYVQRQPGFVCRVDGVPADDPCVNTPPEDAYWSLWWSDGTSGRWTYSSLGAGSLKIPDGGYVGFAWDASSGSVQPGLAPAAHAAPAPSPPPSGAGGSGGSGGKGSGGGPVGAPAPPTSSAAGPPSTPTATEASPGAEPSRSHRPDRPAKGSGKRGAGKPGDAARSSADATPTETPVDETSDETGDETVQPSSADTPAEDGDGLPGWVAPVLVVLLFAGAGGAVLVRRRGSATP